MADETVVPAAAPSTPAPAQETQDPAVGGGAPVTPPEQAQPPEKPPEQAAKEPDLSREWAKLARKERSLREAGKTHEADIAEAKRFRELRELAKTNPMAVLEATNLSYEAITEHILMQGREPTAEDKLRAIEEKLSAREKAEQDAAARAKLAAEDAKVSDFVAGIETAAKADPDRWEAVNEHSAYRDAFDAAVLVFKDTGKRITIEQALDATESVLLEQAQKFTKLKKVQKQFAPPVAETQSSGRGTPAVGAVTLTSKTAGSPPPVVNGQSPQRLSRKEAFDRAVMILEGRRS